MSLPHPDLAIVYNHRDIVCYKLPDISALSAETHVLELRPLWSSQHPSFPDIFARSSFVSKPIYPLLTLNLHVVLPVTLGGNISSRRINPSVLRSSGTPPVRIISTSLRSHDNPQNTFSTSSNLLMSSVRGSDRISFRVVPLDDVEIGDGRGTLTFDIECPVDIYPSGASWVCVDFDETSGRAVVWKDTIVHGRSLSELAIVDLL